LDRNGDGKVDLEEVAAYYNGLIKDGTGDQMVDSAVTVGVQAIDTDGDDKISREEFTAFYKINPREPVKNIDAIFDKLDLDKDGFLTKDELAKLWKQFYFSTNPNDPGKVFI